MDAPDPTDPYGVDLRLTDAGDLAVSSTGELAHVQGPLNVAQAMILRLRTWPDSLPLHPDYGNPLEERLVGRKALDFDLTRTEARAVASAIIDADRRVNAVRNITVDAIDDAGTGVRIGMELVLTNGEVLGVPDVLALDIDALDLTDVDLPSAELGGDELALDDEPEGADLSEGEPGDETSSEDEPLG